LAGPRKRQSQGDEPPTIVDEINDIDEDTESQTSGLPDVFRKMMAMGLSGLFTTEAAVRGALGDSVPREWVDFVSEQSERTREEFAQRLAREFARILEGVDLVELADQLLEGRTIEVKAEFRLGPRDGNEKMGQTDSQPRGPK
jgi:hypothetical protein